MDYASLRREGIRHLQRMAGNQWTDHNAHDPGITILEALCYALTDLNYRASHDIPDLFADGGADPYASLHRPAEILTSRPVTPADLRRLVLDVQGVKNAWIEPLEGDTLPLYYHIDKNELSLSADPPPVEEIKLKGLYRVLIEASDNAGDSGKLLQAQVAHRLHANRGLCEDFVISVLGTQKVGVDIDVEIGPVEEAARIWRQIQQNLADAISPPVPFSTLDEMIKSGLSFDEIFDGPPLSRGFIRDEVLESATRRIAINASDLIHAVMSIPGVRAVRSIQISTGDRIEAWSLPVTPNSVAKLDLAKLSIKLRREGKNVSLDKASTAISATNTEAVGTNNLPLPSGRDRSVGVYWSVQNHLPAIYGVGELGLPASATSDRKAKAKQLKAYLMFFDQIMANHLAQLAHVKDLFSYDSAERKTYFAQPISQPGLGIEVIRPPVDENEVLWTSLGASPGDDHPPLDIERKGRFLNHLLARFAEVIDEQGSPSSDELITRKQELLRRYPSLSGARGTAFNYLEPPSVDNRSGLEQRLRLELGLIDSDKFFVIEHILLRPVEGDEQQTVPLLSASLNKDPYSLQLSFVFPETGRFAEEDFKALVERAIRASTPAHLTPFVRWLTASEFELFEEVHLDWLEKLRLDAAEALTT